MNEQLKNKTLRLWINSMLEDEIDDLKSDDFEEIVDDMYNKKDRYYLEYKEYFAHWEIAENDFKRIFDEEFTHTIDAI